MTREDLIRECERLLAEPRKIWHVDYRHPDDAEPMKAEELDAALERLPGEGWCGIPVVERAEDGWDGYYSISKREVVVRPVGEGWTRKSWRHELLHGLAHAMESMDGEFDKGWQQGTMNYARLELMAELFSARVLWWCWLRPEVKVDCESYLKAWADLLGEMTDKEYRDMAGRVGLWEAKLLRFVYRLPDDGDEKGAVI